MACARFCTLTAAICLVFYFILIEAQEKGSKCENLDLDMTSEEMMKMEECVKEVGAESWKNLSEEKLPCFSKCVITKKNLVDEMGAPHSENIVMSLNSSLPEHIREDLVKLMGTCLTDHASKVDPKDESCVSYIPLVGCFHTSFMDVCKQE